MLNQTPIKDAASKHLGENVASSSVGMQLEKKEFRKIVDVS